MKTRDEHLAMIRQACKPMEPIPTGATAELQPLRNIEAILLDVYGTLLISASGEIGTGDDSLRSAAFEQVIGDAGLSLHTDGTLGCRSLQNTIHRHHHRSREAGIDFPEIDIIEVWRDTLKQLAEQGQVKSDIDQVDYHTMSLQYELLTNPVWPMPGARDCMMELSRRGIRIGLISNAQWFTPLLFPALLGGELDAIGIGTDMQFWSWKFGYAKPGQKLFEHAAQTLNSKGISADRVLQLGNDMLNDVYPAAKVGFRTALFAGDQRSLRRRESDPRMKEVSADLVLLQLHDLLTCIRPQENA
jgi:putative hydrolase of the HAD superfamily